MTTKYDNQSLPELADQIKDHINRAEEHLNHYDQLVVDAAEMMVVAKKRVEGGSAGNADWHTWAELYTDLKKTRIDELLSIGSAEDPLARATEIRELAKDRARKHRDKKKTPLRNGEDETATEDEIAADSETESSGDDDIPPEDDAPEPETAPEDDRPEESRTEKIKRHREKVILEFRNWALVAPIADVRKMVSNNRKVFPYSWANSWASRPTQPNRKAA